MLPLLKIVAVGGVCAGALGCVWWVTNIQGMPFCRDLSTDEGFSETTYNGKFAENYSKYFAGVKDKTISGFKGPQVNMEDWWKWVYKNRYKTTENKKKGFENKGNHGDLKEACKSAYETDANKVKVNTTGDQEIDEGSIWAFCSIGGNKPKSISEVSTQENHETEDTYAKNSKYNTLLISTMDSSNDWFWQIKEVEFFGNQTYPNNLTDSSSNESRFKKLYQDKGNYQTLTQQRVKNLCREAYKENPANSSPFPKDVVFKFCSLSGKAPEGDAK